MQCHNQNIYCTLVLWGNAARAVLGAVVVMAVSVTVTVTVTVTGCSSGPAVHIFFCNTILFAICTTTFTKLCKKHIQWHVEECSVALLCN
jgi:hypothetical protein